MKVVSGALTQPEREVLAQLAQGRRAQAVADHFVVSLAEGRRGDKPSFGAAVAPRSVGRITAFTKGGRG